MFAAFSESEQDEVMKLVSALKTEKMVSSDQFMEVRFSPVLFGVDSLLVSCIFVLVLMNTKLFRKSLSLIVTFLF